MHEPTVEADRQRVAQADQRVADVRARVEKAHGTLHVIGGAKPGFCVARACWSRDFASLAEVEAWLDRIERRA